MDSPPNLSATGTPHRLPRSCRRIRLPAQQLAQDLRELCALGLIEKYTDGAGITRFRPQEDAHGRK